MDKRKGWDSNPCALADKRFSRPPRYDHFDTFPYMEDLCPPAPTCQIIIIKNLVLVNPFFLPYTKLL